MTAPKVSNIFSLTTKRVTDLVLEQSRLAFRRTNIQLDAKMISIITSIRQAGPLTSTQLAAKTGLSRQLVESRLRRLAGDDYLVEEKDSSDLRKRVYAIAPAMTGDVTRAIETVSDFEGVYEDLWAELGVDLHQGLRDLEAKLNSKPLLTRLAERRPSYLEYIREGIDHA